MKKYYISAILIVFCVVAKAQLWVPISLGEEFNYKLSNSAIIKNVIKIDSLYEISGDSVFYLNRIVAKCTGCQDTGTILSNQPQFLKRKMTRLAGTSTYEFTDPGTYTINMGANVGDTWLFDPDAAINATMTSLVADTIFNQPDSVKTITLSTGKVIRISKNHGIIQFPVGTGLAYYILDGIKGRNLGNLLPDFYDMFDFGINDIYQYESANTTPNGGTGGLVKKKIISKTVIPTGYSYETKVTGMRWTISSTGVQSDTIHFSNTITDIFTISDYQNVGIPPLSITSFLEAPATGNIAVMNVYQDTGMNVSRYLGGINVASGTIYQYDGADTLDPIPATWYRENYSPGLGRVEKNIIYNGISVHENLIGYIIDGDTTGIIYPDDVLTGVNSHANAFAGLSVYPNPASGHFYVKMKDFAGKNFSLALVSADGREVFSGFYTNENGTVQVNTGNLARGIYFIKIDGINTGKKIVIR